MRRTVLLILALVPLTGLVPQAAAAQRRPPPAELFTVTPKVGFDMEFDELVVGMNLRIPLRVISRVALQLGGDLTFLEGITERQATVDLLYDFGGLVLGGGPVFRNSVWEGNLEERETRAGYSAVVGLGGSPGRFSAFSVALEVRFVWVEDFRPRPITLGVSVAPSRLFGPDRSGR